ncbi:hypothetical protein CARROT_63 [Serratia phage vB_SmaS_Carrot]|nr:hypothetical protein [Serratia phage vB_SmaS_Opt-148]UGO51869.1 hypothetical protein CARROT_63 [Serratia phage vB_SmaS_Carrot]
MEVDQVTLIRKITMNEYVKKYTPRHDPLQGFERYRKLKTFVRLYKVPLVDIAKLLDVKEQTVRAWHCGSARHQITTENLRTVFDHFGGKNEDGEPNFNPMRDF